MFAPGLLQQLAGAAHVLESRFGSLTTCCPVFLHSSRHVAHRLSVPGKGDRLDRILRVPLVRHAGLLCDGLGRQGTFGLSRLTLHTTPTVILDAQVSVKAGTPYFFGLAIVCFWLVLLSLMVGLLHWRYRAWRIDSEPPSARGGCATSHLLACVLACATDLTKLLIWFVFAALILFECWAAFVNYSYKDRGLEPYNYHGLSAFATLCNLMCWCKLSTAAISAVFIGFNMIPMILCVFLNEQGGFFGLNTQSNCVSYTLLLPLPAKTKAVSEYLFLALGKRSCC
jgi:hypothetical protein